MMNLILISESLNKGGRKIKKGEMYEKEYLINRIIMNLTNYTVKEGKRKF